MKTSAFILMLAILIIPAGLFAQQEKAKAPAAPAETKAQTAPKHTMSPQHMKEHDEMMAKRTEMNARLDAKIAAMDAAKGDQKLEAMAAVIKEMVSQRKEMQEHMSKMREMCMHGMKEGHSGHSKGDMEKETGKK